jgi:hypothetical protein
MPEISLQPIPVMTDGTIAQGQLVLADGSLVAVFTPVSPEDLEDGEPHAHGWFLEAGFGPCSSLKTIKPEVFADIDEAVAWVHETLRSNA